MLHCDTFSCVCSSEKVHPNSPIVGKALVSYDYSSTETNQINLMSGDVVAIISKAGGDRGWWKGAVIHNQELGRVGYFPLAYVEEIEDDGH
ncbi:VAV3 [Bugula neritina]|uniref:VAV3 n=1 Tax=Bugula neritina TaxID=10212 RepID=A0A7J7JLL8_BUGNE|nr:VAV3 [Bugula neritina]